MAMNKKEQAELERLQHELALHHALRFPTYAAPESFEADYFDDIPADLAVVRYTVNTYNGQVTKHLVCRDGVKHFSEKRGDWVPENGWQSHNPRAPMQFFDEKAQALEHLRLVKTRVCAEMLLEIDTRIAEAWEA